MPGYYQPSVAGHLPPTPPDSGSAYAYSTLPYSQDSYAHQTMNMARYDTTYDHQQGYMQSAVTQAPSAYQYQQQAPQPTNCLPPIQNAYYDSMRAPILPPIRTHHADSYQQQLQAGHHSSIAREQQQPEQKEEKATGGVSAKLDYEMERMTDFVTQAAQSIFSRKTPMHPSFRKWVHQVLSATRLPSATILLSLYYLNDRLQSFPGSVRRDDDNQIYRLLAVALVLGSKFLDDNTFVNRSWSDVTSIKVSELNLLEMKWLHLINYQLHVPLEGLPGKSQSLQGWIDSWKKFDAGYIVPKPESTRLSPLDTNLHHYASGRDSRYSPYPTPYTASSRTFESSLSARGSQYSTPYGSTTSWATSNEHQALHRQDLDNFYYDRQSYYPDYAELEAVSRKASEERARQTAYAYSQGSQQSYYPTPTYGTPSTWDNNSWIGTHRSDCNCANCAYQHYYRPYGAQSAYASQTVMG